MMELVPADLKAHPTPALKLALGTLSQHVQQLVDKRLTSGRAIQMREDEVRAALQLAQEIRGEIARRTR